MILITGGSRGIGAATAHKAALAGYDVAINYVSDGEAAAHVSDGLAKELAGVGVRVNAVRPELIRTEIHASAGEPSELIDWLLIPQWDGAAKQLKWPMPSCGYSPTRPLM